MCEQTDRDLIIFGQNPGEVVQQQGFPEGHWEQGVDVSEMIIILNAQLLQLIPAEFEKLCEAA